MREFIAQLESGKLPRFVSEAVGDSLKKLESGLVKITVERYVPRRSNQQNKYAWKVLVGRLTDYLNDMGNEVTKELVHEYIKRNVVPDLCKYEKEIILADGVIETVTGYSTKHLTTAQHSQMAERVRAWAAGQGIQLPLPNERDYETME